MKPGVTTFTRKSPFMALQPSSTSTLPHRPSNAALAIPRGGHDVSAGTISTKAIARVMSVHRFVALGLGLAMILVPQYMDFGLVENGTMTNPELSLLRSCGCFVLFVAYVVNYYFSKGSAVLQLHMAQGLCAMLVLEFVLNLKDFLTTDDPQEKLVMQGFLVVYGMVATAYGVAIYLDV